MCFWTSFKNVLLAEENRLGRWEGLGLKRAGILHRALCLVPHVSGEVFKILFYWGGMILNTSPDPPAQVESFITPGLIPSTGEKKDLKFEQHIFNTFYIFR